MSEREPAASVLSFSDLSCPGATRGPLSFVLRPGLSLVRGGEQRGKTSLLHLIATTAEAQGLSCCFETPADPAHDALLARAWLAQRQQRFAPGWQTPLAAALIEAFRLDEHFDKPLYMLSTGSRRKIGLVAAAASGARLTLLDTPYAALDARSGRLLSELLAEAAVDRQRAWVLADYELPAALAGLPLAANIDLGD